MRHLIKLLSFLLLFFAAAPLRAQSSFPKQCEGRWEGIMHMYARGRIRDSVPVKLTVVQDKPGTWTWKTEYLSTKLPMTKDYKLVLKDIATGTYSTDEGDGIVLADYQFGDKLYSVFETEGVLLTSSYELRGSELIFEVSSGKKQAPTGNVSSYSVDFLQRVVFRRIP